MGGSFDPHEENDQTQLLKSLQPSDVTWEGEIHRVNLAEILLSFIEFGNEGCARACAAAFQREWGPLADHHDLSLDMRFEGARSGRLSTLNLVIEMLDGPPPSTRDMLIAARTGQSQLVSQICTLLPTNVCSYSSTYVEGGEVDSDTLLSEQRGCSCLACSLFESLSDFECFIAVCLNWTFDDDSAAPIVKAIGGLLWRLPSEHVQGIYRKCNSGFICWMAVDSLRHIMAYWPHPMLFLRGLIPDVDEFPDGFLNVICNGLLVGQLRETQFLLESDAAADLQRDIISKNTGLELPPMIADAMPIIVDFL